MTLLTLLQDVATGRRAEEPTAKAFLWSHGVVDNAGALESTGVLAVNWLGGYRLARNGELLLESVTADGLPHVTGHTTVGTAVLIVLDPAGDPDSSNVILGFVEEHHNPRVPGLHPMLRTQMNHAWVMVDGDRSPSLFSFDELVPLPLA